MMVLRKNRVVDIFSEKKDQNLEEFREVKNLLAFPRACEMFQARKYGWQSLFQVPDCLNTGNLQIRAKSPRNRRHFKGKIFVKDKRFFVKSILVNCQNVNSMGFDF